MQTKHLSLGLQISGQAGWSELRFFALLLLDFSGEFMRAVTVLVVFCPCAFILATPTAVARPLAM